MSPDATMANITIFAGSFAPEGWMFCQGQLLSIANYTALYSLIGTTYGGDGQETFALPDLSGRVAIHTGQGTGLQKYALGQQGGVESVTLNMNQIPAHSHPITNATVGPIPASNLQGTTEIPTGNVPAQINGSPAAYSTTTGMTNLGNSNTNTPSGSTGGNGTGGITPVNIVSPYVALNYIIAVEGIFPPHD